MTDQSSVKPVDGFLDAVSACLDRASAEALVRLRAPEAVQQRMETLADRCTEGLLTGEEREEYAYLVQLGTFVSILQARARRQLAVSRAA